MNDVASVVRPHPGMENGQTMLHVRQGGHQPSGNRWRSCQRSKTMITKQFRNDNEPGSHEGHPRDRVFFFFPEERCPDENKTRANAVGSSPTTNARPVGRVPQVSA